jgi:hypothetical protein
MEKSSNKIKKSIIKKETGKVHSVEQVAFLLVNDEKLKDPTKVSNAINNFFITITEKLNTQQVEEADTISFLGDSFPGQFPSIKNLNPWS